MIDPKPHVPKGVEVIRQTRNDKSLRPATA
jgi:hypothetical protein